MKCFANRRGRDNVFMENVTSASARRVRGRSVLQRLTASLPPAPTARYSHRVTSHRSCCRRELIHSTRGKSRVGGRLRLHHSTVGTRLAVPRFFPKENPTRVPMDLTL